VREHRALLGIARARLVQRLDRDELAGRAVAGLIETMDAVVGDERRDAKAIELVTDLELARARQPTPLSKSVLKPLRRETFDTDDERGCVVATARRQRRERSPPADCAPPRAA
jgi:hypothetical protein